MTELERVWRIVRDAYIRRVECPGDWRCITACIDALVAHPSKTETARRRRVPARRCRPEMVAPTGQTQGEGA
jgi:hypothetical protein